MRKNAVAECAGIKVRAIMLARGWKEVDLVSPEALKRKKISRGFFSKFTNLLVRGKELAVPDDPKLALIAKKLGVPVRLLGNDACWPDEKKAYGLTRHEIQTMRWLRSLYTWYITHAGTATAHKYLSLDFDVLQRQSEILQGLARALGDDSVIRVFTDSDHEEGQFDRDFSKIERIALRNRGIRRRILAYVEDIPGPERIFGRKFLPLSIGGTDFEISFSSHMPDHRADVRYTAETRKRTRHLCIRARMDDTRLAFIFAREAGIALGTNEGMIPDEALHNYSWPSPVRSYRQGKAEVLINRFAAAILLPRNMVQEREKEIMTRFSPGLVEETCRELGISPETLMLRIVQLHLKQAHFIRVDASGPEGPFELQKLFRGNGLPVQHDYSSGQLFPSTWGVMKSLEKFFGADELRASGESRHVQVTRMSLCGNEKYICMSLTTPRFGGGAKALCIGFKLGDFRKLYPRTPELTDRRTAVDDVSYDVDWRKLTQLDRESRQRK